MVTNPGKPKVRVPWGLRSRTVGLTKSGEPLFQFVNGQPISQTSQESTARRFPDSPPTPRRGNERDSLMLPAPLSSPQRGSDVEEPPHDPGAITSSPVGQFALDSPIPSPPKPPENSYQATARRSKTARKATESIDSSDDDGNDRIGRGHIRPTTFRTLAQDASAAVLVSSDSKIVIPNSGAAPKPKDDVRTVGQTTEKPIFDQPNLRKNQRTYGGRKHGDGGSGVFKKRDRTSTSQRESKRHKSSQDDENHDSNHSGDENKALPEALPAPDSNPGPPTISTPHHLGSSPSKPRGSLPNRISTLDETPESATQLPVHGIPDLLDSPLRADIDWTTTPTAATNRGRTRENDNNHFNRSSPVTYQFSQPGSPLSDAPSSPVELPPILKPSVCPLCKGEVDRDLLAKYEKTNPNRTVQSMHIFCTGHRKDTAREAWELNGYPDIDWRKLNHRIEKLYPFIQSILKGKQESHYAARFRESIKGGKNKTLRTSNENLTPGYYGIRGLRQMSENLIHEFSSVLRKRALEDGLIGARGYTAYLQAVLVPELATRLVMEDMKVGEEEAREILEGSSWVGDMLNDEVADVVFESDSEESD